MEIGTDISYCFSPRAIVSTSLDIWKWARGLTTTKSNFKQKSWVICSIFDRHLETYEKYVTTRIWFSIYWSGVHNSKICTWEAAGTPLLFHWKRLILSKKSFDHYTCLLLAKQWSFLWKAYNFYFFKETCTSTNAGVHNTIDFKPPLANTSLKTPSRAKCVFFWNYHQSPGLTSQPFLSTEFTKFRVWDQRRKEKGSFGWSEGMESLVD